MPIGKREIKKTKISSLGYDFVTSEYLPEGLDEYHLRNTQNRSGIAYRQLSSFEIEALVRNRNSSDNWNNILVSDDFSAELVKNCKFHGLVRIGRLEPYCLEYSDLKVPVGLYNSTIISCDFGDNVAIDNINYMSHYIVGNEVIIVNVNELLTSNYAKFGNGILKEGEDEGTRIEMELCNENGGRSIIPFNGMLPGDAYLWTRYRENQTLLNKFREFTETKFSKQRGFYGKIGDRTVIKNCKIIKDVWIGEDAYLKGANKLKNLTINSGEEGKSQIGEGVELVNGIVGFGCRIFYGVKAVRFIMASHSQLKYGARLINSYLGNNATISCCEVLNSLIFPAHEQHHNNSFLCASMVMGQSNIAAGATIGSNHNSRSPDGEIVAGRGFWPGLCVSLKHNSRFATYTMISKGDYPTELNIPIPFSLISNDESNNRLVIMPGYWFLYNMYALVRNSRKYNDRDKRIDKAQYIEYDYLAPDSINEMFTGLQLMKKFTGLAFLKKQHPGKHFTEEEMVRVGMQMLEAHSPALKDLPIFAEGFENSRRKVELIKVVPAYHLFKELIVFYSINQILQFVAANKISGLQELQQRLPRQTERNQWTNVGGQLIPSTELQGILADITSGGIQSWDEMHAAYKHQEHEYSNQKLHHAISCLNELNDTPLHLMERFRFNNLLNSVVATHEWMIKGIYDSRAKDYTNPFRKMVYDSKEEMHAVIGRLEDNSFIKQQQEELIQFKQQVADIKKQLKLQNPKPADSIA